MYGNFKIFAGSSHPELARSICAHLGMKLGESLTAVQPDESLEVQIQENVREADVFVIQTAVAPLHQHIFELFLMIDALKGASAARVTAVVPYMPYVRSDKKDKPRISIAARLMADLLVASGADRALTIDLHAPQVQGFFRVPTDQLQAASIIANHLRRQDLSQAVLIAADAGEAKDVGRYANRLNLPMAIIDKRRVGANGERESVELIGDVTNKLAIIVDDEINTAQTLVDAAEFLRERGAMEVKAVATHAALSGEAAQLIERSCLSEVITTDTIPPRVTSEKLTVLSVSRLFARAIQRIHDGTSVSALFR
jgi:ribose-phosphate pyrophosphokinase